MSDAAPFAVKIGSRAGIAPLLLVLACRDAVAPVSDAGPSCPGPDCELDAARGDGRPDRSVEDASADVSFLGDDAEPDDASLADDVDGGRSDASACLVGSGVSSSLGEPVFTGSLFDISDWYQSSSCGRMAGADAVHAWRAPSAGVYRFQAFVRVRYLCCGNPVSEYDEWMLLTLLRGPDCASTDVAACGDRSGALSRLEAGEDVVVVGSSQYSEINRDCSVGDCLMAADYQISITECVPACSSTRPCGDDGCLGSCGTCAAAERCESGTCQ